MRWCVVRHWRARRFARALMKPQSGPADTQTCRMCRTLRDDWMQSLRSQNSEAVESLHLYQLHIQLAHFGKAVKANAHAG